MKQQVLTIIEVLVLTMIFGVAAVFFSASLVSAAEMSTTNSAGSNREITQGDLGRAVISGVSRSGTTSADMRTLTRTLRFTITAENGDVYVPIATSGRGGAIEWQFGSLREVSSTLTSDATVTSGRYVVNEGESETFTITYVTSSRTWYRSEPIVKAIRFSNTVTGRLWTAQFPKAEKGTLPENPTKPVATTSPVASTSPVKVYCISGGQNFPVGTARTSITNADGTTSVIADARFVCRIKDGRGVWEREGSLPGRPVDPTCVRGSVPNNSTQSGIGGSIPRPGTHECLGGTSSSTGTTSSSTGMTGGTSTPKPGVLPKPCMYLNKTYTHGARQPATLGSLSFASTRMSPLVCQNGEWKPATQSTNTTAPSSLSASGAVRGISTSAQERHTLLVDLQHRLSTLLDRVKNVAKDEGEFKVGDAVVTTDALKVRARGAGGVLGVQPAGAAGVVTSSWTNTAGRGWYQVDFATGVDGWVAAAYLKSGVPLEAVTVSFSRHPDTLAASTIVATEGMSETLSPLSYFISVDSDATNTSIAIEKLAVSFAITGADFSEVIESVALSVNGADYSDIIFTSTNGDVTTVVFNIAEPVIIESQNEVLAEVRVVFKDTVATLDQNFTVVAQVSPVDRVLTDVVAPNAIVTFSGSAVGEVHTIVVTE